MFVKYNAVNAVLFARKSLGKILIRLFVKYNAGNAVLFARKPIGIILIWLLFKYNSVNAVLFPRKPVGITPIWLLDKSNPVNLKKLSNASKFTNTIPSEYNSIDVSVTESKRVGLHEINVLSIFAVPLQRQRSL